MLPREYVAQALQRELDNITRPLNILKTYVPLVPQEAPPINAQKGWICYSDGTGGGFNGSSGEGLYRYNGSAWVFVG